MEHQKDNRKEKPNKMGQRWTDEEEKSLLSEIKRGICINDIALQHQRSVGGITHRLRDIAFRFYIGGMDMIDIIRITGLTELQITDAIERREATQKREPSLTKPITEFFAPVPTPISIATTSKDTVTMMKEITLLKEEVKELKEDVKEMLRLIHQLYDFETSS
jgi:hypothetical protein